MTEYAVIQAVAANGDEMAANMREADRDEVWAAAHVTPKQAVRHSLLGSRDSQAGLVDGRTVCLFGVGSSTALGYGVPWMLATDELERHQVAFLRRCRGAVEEMRRDYVMLRNWVDARNEKAIKWLGWLGFEVHDPEPFGIDQLPFHMFEMRN